MEVHDWDGIQKRAETVLASICEVGPLEGANFVRKAIREKEAEVAPGLSVETLTAGDGEMETERPSGGAAG